MIGMFKRTIFKYIDFIPSFSTTVVPVLALPLYHVRLHVPYSDKLATTQECVGTHTLYSVLSSFPFEA